MKKILDRTFWLYLLLGLLNYGFCNAVMLFFNIVLQVPESASILIEFSLQTLISFFLNRFITFRHCKVSKLWPLFSILIVGVCYLLAKVLLRDLFMLLLQTNAVSAATVWLHDLLKVQMEQRVFDEKLVMLLCTFTYSVINYFGQRYLVFRPKPGGEEADA